MTITWSGCGRKAYSLKCCTRRGRGVLKAAPLCWCQWGCQRAVPGQDSTQSSPADIVHSRETLCQPPNKWLPLSEVSLFVYVWLSFSVILLSDADVIHQFPACHCLAILHEWTDLTFVSFNTSHSAFCVFFIHFFDCFSTSGTFSFTRHIFLPLYWKSDIHRAHNSVTGPASASSLLGWDAGGWWVQKTEVQGETLSQKLQKEKVENELLVSLCKEEWQLSISSVSLFCQCRNPSLIAPLLIPPPLLFTPVGWD